MTWFDPPWRVERKGHGMINIVAGPDYFDKDIVAFTANGAPEEVAHKIAAAPELYEALEAAIDHLDDFAFPTDFFKEVLAKARGEQSHKGRAAANNCRPGE